MPVNIDWGDVASVGVPIAGALAGGWMANRQRRQAADKQMQFQMHMRATQYQTAVEDMKRAGLNPALAYSQGGSGTPGGAMPGVDDVISPAVNTAQAARRMREELRLLRAQEYESTQRAGAIGFQNALTIQQQRESEAREERERKNAELLGINTALQRAELPGALNRANVERSRVGSTAAWIDRIAQSLWGAVPRLGMARSSGRGRTSSSFGIN